MFEPMRIRSRLRDYTVHFAGDFRETLARALHGGGFLMGDANVYKHYRDDLDNIACEEARLLLEPSESTKTMETCTEIIERLVDSGVRRGQTLVALGGGVIQDVTAFTASILYRGIEWSFVPTTLLGQADSCIGSKSSINLGDKKNLVGSFYPPSEVFIHTSFLESLPADEIRSGIGEILHYYLYANSPKLELLVEKYADLIADPTLLTEHIYESLTIKKPVVEADEFDLGERQKFNYGHTFGHAIESLTAYSVNHGQAVTVGMDMANYLSVWLGLMGQDRYKSLRALLTVNFPSYDWSTIDVDRYMALLACDKKNTLDGVLTCILAEGPGNLRKHDVPLDGELRSVIARYLADAGSNVRSLG
ncbi:MAG: AroB-related putative sugar phosphate phospholyase (cyclizing) [Gemmatimonadota bacterium]